MTAVTITSSDFEILFESIPKKNIKVDEEILQYPRIIRYNNEIVLALTDKKIVYYTLKD